MRMLPVLRLPLAPAMLAAALVAAPANSFAQQGTSSFATITDMLDRLFVSPTPFNPSQNPLLSQADYERRSQDSIEGLSIGIGNAVASFPLGAASAGFSYRTDPATGEVSLRTVSFGSVFVDRALTSGKGLLNLGASFLRGKYDVLQGEDLSSDGFVVLSQLGTYDDGSGVGDVQRVYLDVDANVFTFAGSYGVTDSFDIGWVVPVADLSVRGRSVRFYNGGKDWDADLPGVRAAYPNKVGELTSIDSTLTKTGVGDVIVRGKYAFGSEVSQGLAVGVDVRLPTGDDENLLGAGKASLKTSFMVTQPLGSSASVHGYSGYTFGGLTDEFNYGAAADVSLLEAKQLTISGEFFGRRLADTVSSAGLLTSFDDRLGGTDPLARRVVVQYGFWNRGSANLLRTAISARYAIKGSWLVTGSVQFRLNDQGYQSKVTPFIGVEHTFSRR